MQKLNQISIFNRFTEDELQVLTANMKFFEVSKGKVLFREGDKGDYICFVVDGRLDVIKRTFLREEIIINTLSRGQSFGEMSIIENSPRSATVKAATKTALFTLTREDFDRIMQDYPHIGTKILKGIALLLSRKLRQTSSRLIDYMATRT